MKEKLVIKLFYLTYRFHYFFVDDLIREFRFYLPDFWLRPVFKFFFSMASYLTGRRKADAQMNRIL